MADPIHRGPAVEGVLNFLERGERERLAAAVVIIDQFIAELPHEHCHWHISGACDGVCHCHVEGVQKAYAILRAGLDKS